MGSSVEPIGLIKIRVSESKSTLNSYQFDGLI